MNEKKLWQWQTDASRPARARHPDPPCQIIGQPEVIVVGSQSILGSVREDLLPAEATMSIEIDILPIADDNGETARLADMIEGVAGEFRPSRRRTASASTASTSGPRRSRRVGAAGS